MRIDRHIGSGTPRTVGSTMEAHLPLYQWMYLARCVDELERELIARGEAFFHVGSAGHEATAALAQFLQPDDYLHCHYRDKALMLARGVPAGQFFNSLLCNDQSHSAGRQMSAHLSDPARRILSIVGPVGNNALQSAGIAHQIKAAPKRPLVLCSLGDGTSQQGEVMEAIAESVRSHLPVLFLIEDNKLSISTRTAGKTFFSMPDGESDSFYGLPIRRLDGANAVACAAAFQESVNRIRTARGPELCVMTAARLSNHTNADDETVYRTQVEISRLRESADPVRLLRERLLEGGVDPIRLENLEEQLRKETRHEAETAIRQRAPQSCLDAKAPLAPFLMAREAERRHDVATDGMLLTMAEALRETLHERMRLDERITLLGEDIEDPKGDVFGLTRGLSDTFPGRVSNSALSESTIIGTSIGRALAGGRPVAFIQFADFLPLAFNQLATELASMHWRTQGGWSAPVIVMVACGGYRPGLGPFHSHTGDSLTAHLPGLDVLMPSTAVDAAGMLNAAFESRRPTIFLYPKALLNATTGRASPQVSRQFVPIGKARIVRPGGHLTLVGWGNTVPICERVATELARASVTAEVIDLRWLSPWDAELVQASAERTGHLLVVHEDNLTGGFGAEIVATVCESARTPVKCRRVARPDTFVPCHFGNQLEVLPSIRRTLEAAAELVGLEVRWELPAPARVDRQVVMTIGSSPSDQTVEVVALTKQIGDFVQAGETIASLEADKAVVDMASPADGWITDIHLKVGDQVAVDVPLLTLAVDCRREPQPTAERTGIPRFTSRKAPLRSTSSPTPKSQTVSITGLGTCRGNARLTNEELAVRFPQFGTNGDARSAAAGILERTGIASRLVADESQSALTMGVDAALAALEEAGIRASDLSLVICSTSTPELIAPSTACRILARLDPKAEVAAYDLQAACSGYLYALANGWDFLQVHPGASVLVITTETMRRVVDIDDPDTSPIFADAATATVLRAGDPQASGSGHVPLARLHRPVLGARGEDGSSLNVPPMNSGRFVRMEGKPIFSEAIRRMGAVLSDACAELGITPADLDLIVPHQANGRIIEALRNRLRLPPSRVRNDILNSGNTSSSSIPLALSTVLRQTYRQRWIGLTTFGAGFTFAATLLENT